MCIHLWDCIHSSSGWWQDHYICCIHFTGNWWLAGIIHWLVWVILYNSLHCIDLNHKSLHKPWLFRIYDWTRYAVAKCPLPHSKYFDMCERFDCQVWSMFTTEPVLRTLHSPPPPLFQNVHAENRKWENIRLCTSSCGSFSIVPYSDLGYFVW